MKFEPRYFRNESQNFKLMNQLTISESRICDKDQYCEFQKFLVRKSSEMHIIRFYVCKRWTVLYHLWKNGTEGIGSRHYWNFEITFRHLGIWYSIWKADSTFRHLLLLNWILLYATDLATMFYKFIAISWTKFAFVEKDLSHWVYAVESSTILENYWSINLGTILCLFQLYRCYSMYQVYPAAVYFRINFHTAADITDTGFYGIEP